MRADARYRGHDTHTHFYHCPHWFFTVLFYADIEDMTSAGTGIERLLPRAADDGDVGSYRAHEAAWLAKVAKDTFGWKKPSETERRFERTEYHYRANRL